MHNLKTWCRLCATDGIHKVDIFLKDIDNNSSIADDLNKLCNLKLENKTELPTKICEECIISIKNLKQFLLNSIKTQKLLTETLYNEVNDYTQLRKKCKVVIDSEIKQEDDIFSTKVEYNMKKPILSENEVIEEKEIKQEILRKKFVNKTNFKGFLCKICEKKCSSQTVLTTHMKIRHSNNKEPHTCKFCGKKFKKRQPLEIHENTHLPSEERKQLLCPHCDKKFTTEGGRWSHIHSVHDKKQAVICEECGKEFSTKHRLAIHKISHTVEKKFHCSFCPAKFKAKGGLTTHMYTHGESHPCLECGLQLKTKQLLKNHMVVHSNVKDFKCNFCNKDFKRLKELNCHLIIHTGIKPFECRICNQKFVHNMTYRRHLKATHPKEFTEMVSRGERISCTNFPSLEQLKAMNQAAKTSQIHDAMKIV